MLIYFKVGNYRSVKEPVVLNFQASAIGEHQESNVRVKNRLSLLKTILLFGSNASGKTKILDALVFFRWSILNSATELSSTDKIATESFALSTETVDEPSHFEAEFFIGKIRYRYGFEADEDSIKKEWLLEVRPTTLKSLFLRIGQEFQIDHGRFENTDRLETKTRKNALFLSVAAQWNAPLAEKIIAWFDSIFTIHGLMDADFKQLTTEMLKDERLSQYINKLICDADLGIRMVWPYEFKPTLKDESFAETKSDKADLHGAGIEKDMTAVLSMHMLFDEKGQPVGEVPFIFEARESDGTKKFYNLIGVFLKAVLEGRVVIIDELDARMHTLLSKAIVQLFNSNEIDSDAQLIAVTHDTALLDRELLRRDQVNFVEKNAFAATRVNNLVEFKVRKEAPFDKNYLEGKYGAIPFIKDLELSLNDGKK